MVSSSTSNFTTIPSTFSIPITEKLSKHNYLLWHAQIMPPIWAARYEDLLLGVKKATSKIVSMWADDSAIDKPNPEYDLWMSRDQMFLGYLLSSMTREVLMGVTTHTSSMAVWSALDNMFSPRTRSHSVNTRIALATTKKGTSTVAEYFAKMKNYVDEMSTSRQPLEDEEFAAYVLIGLNEELYNTLVSSIVTQVEPISPSELYSQMLSYEHRVDKAIKQRRLLHVLCKCCD
jgi:hypothetical protein